MCFFCSQPNRIESRFINASLNYWGHFGDVNDIGARIYDQYDNKTLMQVNYYPPYVDSTRLRQGKRKSKESNNERISLF